MSALLALLIAPALAGDQASAPPAGASSPSDSGGTPASAPSGTDAEAPAAAPAAEGAAAPAAEGAATPAAPSSGDAPPAPLPASAAPRPAEAAAGAAEPAAAPPASEASVPVRGRRLPISSWGEARLYGSLPPDTVVDTEGHTVGQGFVLESRLRAGVAYTTDEFKVDTEWDLFSGQLAGDPWDIRGTEDERDREVVDVLRGEGFKARRLALSGVTGPLAVEAGLVTSHWGLGMLANDGAHDPLFGRSDFGDRVIRVRLATRPLKEKPLVVVVAGDRVVADELAQWSPLTGGPAAWQVIGSALWAPKEGLKAGLYGVYRNQTEVDGLRRTSVGVLDGYVDAPFVLGPVSMRVAAEAAGILGSTSRGLSYNARDSLAVRSGGATALVEVAPNALPVTVTLRGGWASGDGDPDDGHSNDFTFDRDFDAGMVMFDELQGAVDAAAYAQLTDESHAGRAPYGAEVLVAEGAVRHASFAQAAFTAALRPWLQARAGVLLGWNTSPIAQPFASYRAGGVPTNHLGVATTGYALGTELDWSVTLGGTKRKLLGVEATPALLVQGGHYLASADMGGGVHTLVTASGRIRW